MAPLITLKLCHWSLLQKAFIRLFLSLYFFADSLPVKLNLPLAVIGARSWKKNNYLVQKLWLTIHLKKLQILQLILFYMQQRICMELLVKCWTKNQWGNFHFISSKVKHNQPWHKYFQFLNSHQHIFKNIYYSTLNIQKHSKLYSFFSLKHAGSDKIHRYLPSKTCYYER